MTKKILLLSLVCLLISDLSFSQNDPKAQSILFGAYQKYKTYQNIKINFTTITEHKSRGVYQTQTGVAYVKGMNHVIELNDRDIISDGRTIWTHMKNAKKVFISNYNPNDGKITPDEVFREDFLSRGLTYTYIEQDEQESPGSMLPTVRSEDIIEFLPRESKRNYLKFRLFIDRSTHLVNHWKVFMKNGSTIDYQMNITPNNQIPDSFFKYSAHRFPASAQVVDLRKP